ncbi:MAG: LacI family DNA-binding transcriptional regulator [Peptoniphilaceae bacterium]|nr:LacI family DNA-binding transcriptional regulator [Peptoniphilaceae bacterium]MDY6086215.1 LacI family DNA-binding transcriptional regulator [Peptoniphilaceae bacterium]
MRTTLRDIAKASNVSVTTVSLVLNGKANEISEATQKRVLAAARKLEYTPNLAARGLQKASSNLLLLLVPDLENTFYTSIARHAVSHALTLGYLLILASLPQDQKEEERLLKMVKGGLFEGMLILSRKFAAIRDEASKDENIPYVMLDEDIEDETKPSLITGDNESGGYLVGDYLCELGHRRIAFLTGPNDTPNSMRRLSGAVKAINDRGYEVNPRFIFEGDYSAQSGYQMMAQIMKNKPSALFCFNDFMAYGFLRACKENGVQVPHDISVVGYDALVLRSFLIPELTTVDQHAEEIGKIGVEKLIGLIQTHEKETILIQPSLIIGETTDKY